MMKKQSSRQHITSYRSKIVLVTLTPVLLLILVSVLYFTVTINRILQENFEKDIHLYIQQLNDNFSSRMNTLYNLNMLLVSDESLNQALKGGIPAPDTYEAAIQKIQIEERMENSAIVTTYSLTTADNSSLLERFYLFRDSGTSYKAIFKNRGAYEKDYDQLFQTVYQSVASSGQSSAMGIASGVLWYAFTFSDPDTDEVRGTFLYHLNPDSLAEIPDTLLDYEGAFWQIKNSGNVTLLSSSAGVPSEEYISSTCPVPSLGMTLSLFIPREQTKKAASSTALVYIMILVALAAVLLIVCSIFIYRINTPFNDLVRSIEKIQQGDLQTRLPDYRDKEFHELSQIFNSMTAKINYLVNDVYHKQLLLTEAELKALQAQMNPHFIFNVLNAISIQAQMDGNETTSQMVYSLSQLMQASIIKKGTEKVTLTQELEYARFFVYLQNHRFGGKLQYQVNCTSPELLDCYLPRLTLQPLIENAVIHGLEPKYGDCRLAVNIYSADDSIFIDVIDNGVGFTPTEMDLELSEENAENSIPGHKNIGLANSHKIIRHFYGIGYGISILSSPGNGCQVTMHIPMDKGGRQPCTT